MKRQKKYEVGDVEYFTIGGIEEEMPFTVVDVKKDNYTGRNNVIFGSDNILAPVQWFNVNEETNERELSDWNECYLRKWLHDDFYLRLPKEVRFNIMNRHNKCVDFSGNFKIIEDKVWVPSLHELGFEHPGINEDKKREGECFDFFKDGANREWLYKDLCNTGIDMSMYTRSQLRPDYYTFIIAAIHRADGFSRHAGVAPFFMIQV